jgi:hypothetical protein
LILKEHQAEMIFVLNKINKKLSKTKNQR